LEGVCIEFDPIFLQFMLFNSKKFSVVCKGFIHSDDACIGGGLRWVVVVKELPGGPNKGIPAIIRSYGTEIRNEPR